MLPPIADRFVAGESIDGAVAHVRDLDDAGIASIVNLLGEHYDDPEDARADTEEYLRLLERFPDTAHPPSISVKPSQLGLNIGEDVFRDNLARIVEVAAAADTFVWIDMEGHETTDATVRAYEALAEQHDGGVGICLQANLRRTADDVTRLGDTAGKIRLVKGAYDEPESIAYRDGAAVEEAYRHLLHRLFTDTTVGIAVATHDEELIEYALDLGDQYDRDYEFQMLMGVREDRQRELAATETVYQYVPYGSAWASYFYRRIRERRENLRFALRAVVDAYSPV
ncbi:proline dehydrogenase family protein [Haloplanus aerogenes]|uniref:proline dehydrogenase n=1 Tax=Haloplanus aerogenes TaxID=660522 RepID=A0A3M0D334_9EURY|nr:proline dehydrogenase family protein [Haloplanus aerogenes]AZH25089.1 proline dehydrogenase [Haloplanus aerogenes]RMB13689.1 L-proline dehydrogenase [Haloplanus aerogenes]